MSVSATKKTCKNACEEGMRVSCYDEIQKSLVVGISNSCECGCVLERGEFSVYRLDFAVEW